jgi:hypothetical protein
MRMTLVIDTGQDIVGIYSVADRKYKPYRGKRIVEALERIKRASEVVTYNGASRDFLDLAAFAGLMTGERFPIAGTHIDMREVCWSARIWGSNLTNTYSMHFPECPTFPDTYEGSNERDVYMTFRLWELWKQGKLKVLDGQYLQAQTTITHHGRV